MPDSNPGKPTEETASTWPSADYREWIQTNIANQMITRLFAGGITMITVAAGVVLWLQDSSIKSIQIETQSQLAGLERELRAQIDIRIDDRIDMKLTDDEELLQELFDEVKTKIQDYIGTDDYRERVRTAIIQDQTLEDLIRQRGIDIAENIEDNPIENRKLGLQLYGLFQPIDTAEQQVDADKRENFRADLVSILEKEVRFSELSATILSLYNFRACQDFESDEANNACKSNDRRAVTATVALYGSTTDESDKEVIANWLSDIPIAHAYILTNTLVVSL